MRPDDLAAQMVQAALDKVPALDTTDVNDLIFGCGLPGGEQGFNMSRNVAVQLGYDRIEAILCHYATRSRTPLGDCKWRPSTVPASVMAVRSGCIAHHTLASHPAAHGDVTARRLR